MKVIDFIFALICGKIIGSVAGDFLSGLQINIGLYEYLVLWIMFPIVALFCLWLASLAGQKFLFIYQATKFFLIGMAILVIDLKTFETLLWLSGYLFHTNISIFKGISFIIATFVKYWANKYWAFAKPEKENVKKEVFQFFLINLAGLAMDVGIFYFFARVIGPQFGASMTIWLKISVIFSAIFAAIFNFLSYKFLVFKK